MHKTRNWRLRAARLALAAAVGAPLLPGETQVERGRYLVEEVGKCGMCHTPLVDGKPDKARHMKGAVLPAQPIEPIKGWHKTSPDLTPGGRLWTKWGEKGILTYMVTGLNPGGREADAPMPTYKLTQDDAAAVVAYLKSLQ
jgi:mono/diheme cytochrome c family protein